jgi:hypothetical protein
MKGTQLRKYVCVPTEDRKQRFEISGFRPDVVEDFALLVGYAA